MLRPRLRLVALLIVAASGATASAQSFPSNAPDGEAQSTFVPPKLQKRMSAPYPAEALAQNLTGTVVLEFDVDEKGVVHNVQVKQGAGHGFDEAAAAAVKQFVFSPGTSGGLPVTAHVTYAYKFAIKQVAAPPKPKPPADQTIRIRGGVFLEGTRAPVEGGTVVAIARDTTGQYQSEIDDQGHFALKLPPGAYHLIVNGPKARRFEHDEKVGDKEVLTVNYFVAPSQYTRYESTVRSNYNREEISRITLTTEELVKMPGTMGDALRAIESLPGVGRPPLNLGLIIVRGSKPTDSRVYLGSSEVPQLYHFAALRSVVPSEMIERIDFMPGNFSVRYGRATGGTIDVELREGKRDCWHGYAETNVFDTGLMTEGPVGQGLIMLGARRSYIDALLAAVSPPGLTFVDAPVYYDYQGVFDYPVAGGKLRAEVLGSDDTTKLLFSKSTQADPALTEFGTHIFFHKLQLRYVKSFGKWQLFSQIAGGYQGQSGALGSSLQYAIGIGNVDARVEGRYLWSKKLRFLVGLDGGYSNVVENLDVPQPPHEGQIPSPLSALQTLHQHATQNYLLLGLFVEALWRPIPQITITPGIRFDEYSALHHQTFDPRITGTFELARFTTLKAGAGRFSQPPVSIEYDNVFGNPGLRPEKAVHLSLGLEQGIAPGLLGEVTGFYKHLWDLSTPTNAYELRDGKVHAENYASIGEGRIYGLEVTLRQLVSKWFFGWVSYTLLRSERRDCATCNWRIFDYDQTHILVLALHSYLPRGWELGLRFRYITGLPFTPAYGGYYNADSDVYAPANGPINTARISDYHALDFRVDKTFLFKRWLLRFYLDITNVYNHASAEQSQPSFDFTRRAEITGLPIIPSFGIRGEFSRLALLALLAIGCVHPVAERCPACVVVDADHHRLPPLKSGARRMFILVPGVLGYGWEWDEAVQALTRAPHDDYLVFWWAPWGSVRKASKELHDTLGRALWTTPGRITEVVVVAHSMGGIVAAHALSGLRVPAGKKLTILTIGAPLGGMMGPPFSLDDALGSPAMMSVMGTFRDYPELPSGARMIEYVTSYPSDPVMQPRYGHQVAPPEIGPHGAHRIAVDGKFDHNKIVSKVVLSYLATGKPPEELKP